MKRIIIAAAVALAVLAPSVATYAATPSGRTTTAKKVVVPAKKPQSAVCPVLGTKIPDVSRAAGKSVYKGKTYYFCCAGCKPLFDKNPEKYIHPTSKAHTSATAAPSRIQSAVCPVMGTKIPDVRHAAGKSVYKGKTYYFCCPGCKPLFDKNPGKYVK